MSSMLVRLSQLILDVALRRLRQLPLAPQVLDAGPRALGAFGVDALASIRLTRAVDAGERGG